MAQRPDVRISFGAGHPQINAETVRLPLPTAQDGKTQTRGLADSAALWLHHHDAAAHANHMPAAYAAQNIYTALEHVRVQAIGAHQYPGVRLNLAHALEQRLAETTAFGENAPDSPPADFVRAWALHLLGDVPLGDNGKTALEAMSAEAKEIIGQASAALKANLRNAEGFATRARQLVADLHLDDPESGEEDQQTQSDTDEDTAESASAEESDTETPENQSDTDADDQDQADGAETSKNQDENGEDGQKDTGHEQTDAGEGDSQGALEGHNSQANSDESLIPTEPDYKAFTTKYDVIASADALCDADELVHLRNQLDKKLADLRWLIARLANRLQRRLMAQQTRDWDFDLEEGLLDTSRLARVVANPTYGLSFMHERETTFKDTVVTLLIDNSGSMRGRPITVAAQTADIMARTLERCGIKVEVLGFTTRGWKGGQSQKDWIAAGRPEKPGRLNDLCHIIYKAADTPWRRGRNNLGLMLKEGLLKENIDGEALEWAHKRLAMRAESRRILMVISDGAPVDDATLTNNSPIYLEHHLRDVIERIEQRSNIQLTAIGIGHDVTRYYKRAVTISNPEDLGGTVLNQLLSLFEDSPQRHRPKTYSR
jgi:cobaltochelatase CobT